MSSSSDFALRRCRSVSTNNRPTILVTKTNSIPDLTAHIRSSAIYRSQILSKPYRRDWHLFDDYWTDRHHYYKPTYHYPGSTYAGHRYSYSDYLTSPYTSIETPTYLPNYSNYSYDYPGYYRRYSDSYYDQYLRSLHDTPYRSWVLDSMSTSLARGTSMYKNGLINYSTLDRYWMTPHYWDRRFKDWRELYTWDKDRLYLPSYWDRRARQYFTYYNNG